VIAAGAPTDADAAPAALAAALAAHRPGFALPRAFALDPEIHDAELDAIWRRSWLMAGTSGEAARPGDYFRLELSAGDSVIVVRGHDGELVALHNTCRHRGMPVCEPGAGRVDRWICPYHRWTYDLDGTLLGGGGLPPDRDRAEFGLHRAGVAEAGGLVFVWLGRSPGPEPFAAAGAELSEAAAAQGIATARLAHRIDYRVAANWKLVWENNRECWHCPGGHPEYVQANFDTAPDTPAVRTEMARRAARHAQALATVAAPAARHERTGLYGFPTPGRWWSANRTPLRDGFVTESLHGRPVAPPMGEHRDPDVGTLRLRTLPNFWCHASSDHAVLTRLLPDGPGHTRVQVSWLVDQDAVAGRDYELAELLPFWQLTSEQDWSLCERNHRGVSNPAFTPGPYHPQREANVLAFVDWYLARMRAAS
jgi:glycine betaine catabolism A